MTNFCNFKNNVINWNIRKSQRENSKNNNEW